MTPFSAELLERFSHPRDVAALLLGGGIGYLLAQTVLPGLERAQAGVIGSVIALGLVQATTSVGGGLLTARRRAGRVRKFLKDSGEDELVDYLDREIRLFKAIGSRTRLSKSVDVAISSWSLVDDPTRGGPAGLYLRYRISIRSARRAGDVNKLAKLMQFGSETLLPELRLAGEEIPRDDESRLDKELTRLALLSTVAVATEAPEARVTQKPSSEFPNMTPSPPLSSQVEQDLRSAYQDARAIREDPSPSLDEIIKYVDRIIAANPPAGYFQPKPSSIKKALMADAHQPKTYFKAIDSQVKAALGTRDSSIK